MASTLQHKIPIKWQEVVNFFEKQCQVKNKKTSLLHLEPQGVLNRL
jgi:hypothetical protein